MTGHYRAYTLSRRRTPPNFMTAPEIRRKKYGASRQPPKNIQISAVEYFSAEPMTPLDLYLCTHVTYRSVA